MIHTEETVKRLSASFPFCIIHRLHGLLWHSLCVHTHTAVWAAENSHVEYSSTQHHDWLTFHSCHTQRFIGYKPSYRERLRWTLTLLYSKGDGYGAVAVLVSGYIVWMYTFSEEKKCDLLTFLSQRQQCVSFLTQPNNRILSLATGEFCKAHLHTHILSLKQQELLLTK